MTRTFTLPDAQATYLAALSNEARRAQAMADAAITAVLRGQGVVGPCTVQTLEGTTLVVEVPEP